MFCAVRCNNNIFEPFSCDQKSLCTNVSCKCIDSDFNLNFPFKLKICFGRRYEWDAARRYCIKNLFGRFLMHIYSEIYFTTEEDMKACYDHVTTLSNANLNNMLKYEA